MLITLLRFAARLPLSWLQGLGAAAGRAVFRLSPRYAERLRANLAQSRVTVAGMKQSRLERQVAAEIGKGAFELIAIWFRPTDDIVRLVLDTHGYELVEQAKAGGRGLLFLTPHLGSFEAAALYVAMRMPLTVMYRPPKLAWLDPLMRAGRTRGHCQLVPTNLGGVRQILKALKSGEAAGLLPDHVPGAGEGAWAPFFGKPAFTMTLAGRLQASTGCVVLMVFARRLPGGRGFEVTFEPVPGDLSGPEGLRRLNATLEDVIRRCPEQYLWSYNRYKVPAGVAAPEGTTP
ncbi:MAG: lysophospholipid acyltransferase family protein [Burkholderiales bacterium]